MSDDKIGELRQLRLIVNGKDYPAVESAHEDDSAWRSALAQPHDITLSVGATLDARALLDATPEDGDVAVTFHISRNLIARFLAEHVGIPLRATLDIAADRRLAELDLSTAGEAEKTSLQSGDLDGGIR